MRTNSTVKLLKIDLTDFRARAPSQLIDHLKAISETKQHLKHIRMDHISKAAISLKTGEDLHDFHGRALSAVI